jgi:hypothetical protein
MRGNYFLGAFVLASACATTAPPPANTAASSRAHVALAEQPGARRDPDAERARQREQKIRERAEVAQVQQQIRQLESPGH